MKPATEYNLDAMNESELQEFVEEIGNGIRPIRAARLLFPGRKDGTVNAAKALLAYAWNKLTAISCRKAGNIPAALKYEAICERIYRMDLPEWAKGW